MAEAAEKVLIYFHSEGKVGTWIERIELLNDPQGHPRWQGHPIGETFDVVALKLNDTTGAKVYELNLSLADKNVEPGPGAVVSIIGYPGGMSVDGGWPVWKTGHIASDTDLDYDNKPSFLVDVTARVGMSRSPVVLRTSGAYRQRDGKTVVPLGITTLFLGVYSAQYKVQEIGLVWRPIVIKDILGI